MQTTTATTPELDPHSRDLLLRIGALTAAVPPAGLTLERRRSLAREANALLLPERQTSSVRRENLDVPLPGRTLPARLYRPQPNARATAARDVLLVFFHGGGWVVGDLETHDNACAFLCAELGCALLSVEYRKAPEHAFPAPCDDAAEAYAWAAAQAPGWACRRIAVAGDSAGGHLAAHAMFANPGVETAAALLFYPVADRDFANPSYTQRGAGPGLTSDAMCWLWDQFVGSTPVAEDARAVLMRQRWQRRPPPTVISVAWHDPLYAEGVAYAGLLRNAGADVRLHEAGDMAHGFLRQCSVNASARQHLQAIADLLLDRLAQPARA